MPKEEWEVVETVGGSLQAEILGGLLEAQGIPVTLSQEGAGHFAFAVTVGPLGEVQILVPSHEVEHARQVLEDYRSGEFEDEQLIGSPKNSEDQEGFEPIGGED